MADSNGEICRSLLSEQKQMYILFKIKLISWTLIILFLFNRQLNVIIYFLILWNM